MQQLFSIIKRIIIVIAGLAWGMVSFFWLGYSLLTIGNLMEEPGSFDYVAEGESMRIYGLIGCALYIMILASILYCLYKKRLHILYFLLSMILGGVISALYIFVIR